MRACVYACMCDVSGEWTFLYVVLLCYCVYVCMCACVHVCMRICVAYPAYSGYGSGCECVFACLFVCVCACAYACMCGLFGVLKVW